MNEARMKVLEGRIAELEKRLAAAEGFIAHTEWKLSDEQIEVIVATARDKMRSELHLSQN